MASRFVNMYLGLFGLALFPRRKFIPTKHMRHSGPFPAQWTWMTCLFLSWTWIGDVWSKILNLAIYRQLIQFQTIKMLAKCTRKNGNTPPRVARCGIFSFSPLQPSLMHHKAIEENFSRSLVRLMKLFLKRFFEIVRDTSRTLLFSQHDISESSYMT